MSSLDLLLPSPLEEIFIESINRYVFVKRDDKIHPIISGNKWRKIKAHLPRFANGNYAGISSMGGLFSNHLHALSYTCHQLKIKNTLYFIGHPPKDINYVVQDCINWNSEIQIITRQKANELRNSQIGESDYLWIKEGGFSNEACKAMSEVVHEMPDDFDRKEHIIGLASGTGTSLLGILEATENIRLAYFHVVRSHTFGIPEKYKHRLIPLNPNLKYRFGDHGIPYPFVKELFYSQGILFDPLYTGPALFYFCEFLKSNCDCDKIFFLHTGGLQAWRNYNLRYKLDELC